MDFGHPSKIGETLSGKVLTRAMIDTGYPMYRMRSSSLIVFTKAHKSKSWVGRWSFRQLFRVIVFFSSEQCSCFLIHFNYNMQWSIPSYPFLNQNSIITLNSSKLRKPIKFKHEISYIAISCSFWLESAQALMITL